MKLGGISVNKENTEKLLNDFPKLYRQYYLDASQSCMSWGFECPDSWFPFIYELSQNITQLSEKHSVIVEAAQVKEKFYELRFYIDTNEMPKELYNQIEQYIIEAEEKIKDLERNKNG
jgi:phosphatidylinositol kinase/protein kinase (PI-3  family)